MKKYSSHTGFTLLELIISFGIMSIVIFGAASLYVTSIRGNTAQIERFIGYNLAQEGLEGVRNIRDSYFRQGLAWDGSSAEATLVEAPFLPGTYRIFRKATLGTLNALDQKEAAFAASPWIFQACPKTQNCDDQLYRVDGGGAPYFVHKQDIVTPGMTESPYRRTIVLEFLKDNGDKINTVTDRMLVTAHVDWIDHGTAKFLDLSTEFTNWKQRPF